MPLVQSKKQEFTPLAPTVAAPEPVAPNLGTTIESAFALGSDVKNFIDLMSKPNFEYDPKFDLNAKLTAEGLTAERENYYDVFSEEHFNARRSQIYGERQHRANLMAAGWPGVVASIGAGVLSPTTLLPLTTYARGLKAVAAGAGLGLVSVGGQEAVLQAAQETRTPEESMFTIATGTFLGAILGGAAGYLRPGETVETLAKGMDDKPGLSTISVAHGGNKIPEAEIPQPIPVKYSEPVLSDKEAMSLARQELTPRWNEAVQEASDQLVKYKDVIPEPLAKKLEKAIDSNDDGDWDSLFTALDGWSRNTNLPGEVETVIDNIHDLTTGIQQGIQLDARAKAIKTEYEQQVKYYRTADHSVTPLEDWLKSANMAADNPDDEFLKSWARTPVERKALQTAIQERRMAEEANVNVPTNVGTPQSGGSAAVARPSAGGLKPAIPGTQYIFNQLSQIGPITRGLTSEFDSTKWIVAQFGQEGLRLEGNLRGIAGSPTGSIEHSIGLWDKHLADGALGLEKAYQNYIFNGKPPTLFPDTRADLGSLLESGKVSRQEFYEAVGNAKFVNGEGATPEVAAAAKFIQETIYKPLDDVAKELKVYKAPAEMVDAGYLNRLYNNDEILKRFDDWTDMLAEHINLTTVKEFNEDLAKFFDKKKWNDVKIEDFNRPLEEVEELRASYEQKLEDLEAGRSEELAEGEEQIADLREEAAFIRQNAARARTVDGRAVEPTEREKLTIKEKTKALNERVRELTKLLGKPFEELTTQRSEIKRRLKSLSRNKFIVGNQYAAKLAKIDRLEELQLKSMNRVIKKAEKVAKDLDKYSHEELVAKAEALRGQFNELAEALDRGDEKLHELGQGFETQEVLAKAPLDERLGEFGQAYGFQETAPNIYRLTVNGKLLGDSKGFSLEEVKQEITKLIEADPKFRYREGEKPVQATPNEALVQSGLRLEQLQESRAARLTRLAERLDDAESLDDDALREWIAEGLEEVKGKVNDLNSKRAIRRDRLAKGAEKISPSALEEAALKIADKTKVARGKLEDKYQPLGDVDIDTGTGDFMEKSRDAAAAVGEKITGVTNRIQGLHLILSERGPEIARSLNIPSTFVSSKGVRFADFLVTDINKTMRAYLHTLAADIEITRKFGSPDAASAFDKMTKEFRAKSKAYAAEGKNTDKLVKQYEQDADDVYTLLERAKRTRGIPKDPRSFMARAGRTMMALNAARLMGTVLVSSIADPARAVQKYGLTRTFRDGWAPFVAQTKQFKISKREARLAAIGLDPIIHTRAMQIYDMIDEVGPRSKFEKGIEYASSRIGMLGGFDYWTSVMKEISSSVAIVKLSDSLGIVAGGAKASAKDTQEAIEFLAAANIGRPEALNIWDEMNRPGGGDLINKVLIPNTANWADQDAVRAFRTALRGEADNTIVTPGFGRPSFMDNTLPGRMISQFKSFSAASTTKTLMAGLQQRDANFVTGSMVSLALGAMSYYLWAVSTGGKAYEDMQAAGADKWADEAIVRSGNLAVFGEIQRIAEKIPFTSQFASFSGQGSTRYEGDSLVAALMGPSFDLMQRGSQVLMGMDEPTQATAHALRAMLPFQNLFWLRQAYDAIEKNSGLPEKREPQQ